MANTPFALPTTKEEHFKYMREGMLERWDEWLEVAFCRILRRFVVFERMTKEDDIFKNFNQIHRAFVQETGAWYTVKDSYRMYNVLRERYRTFQWLLDQPGVFHDPFDYTVHVPFLVAQLALKHWPLVHYVLNVPEPRWEALKGIFEPMGELSKYPDEVNQKTPRHFPMLCLLFGKYLAHLQGTITKTEF